MGQGEVMDYLERCKKPKKVPEIAEALDKAESTISVNMEVLRRTDKRLKWIETDEPRNKGVKRYFV